jgi:hypothetical protein
VRAAAAKAGLAPLLLAAAFASWGLGGVVLHQLSYAAAPDCFWSVVFERLDIPFSMSDRGGVAVTGWRSGSWAGLLLAGPILCASLPAAGPAEVIRAFVRGLSAAAPSVLLTALGALALAVERAATRDGLADLDAFDLVVATQLGIRLGLLIGAAAGIGVAAAHAVGRSARSPGLVDTHSRRG